METKNPDELIKEITTLKQRLQQLEKQRAFSWEDCLKLSIIDKAPFTMWACNRNFEIVLWAGACEEIYGYSREEAIGKNYLDLFVDKPEREESEKDCIEIIEEDKRQTNCFAFDYAKNKDKRNMLTNCFRVHDEFNDRLLQAEVAFEISDIEKRREFHRIVREKGLAKTVFEKGELEVEKLSLLQRLKVKHEERITRLKTLFQDAKIWGVSLKREIPKDGEELYNDLLHKLEKEKIIAENQYEEIKKRISDSKNMKDVKNVEDMLMEYDKYNEKER